MHEAFMRRCLQLAEAGRGRVSPNPLVGSVIVRDGRIIGEGYHAVFGGPHAERVAIGAVGDPQLLAASTLYVSLEPCCHHGKTPPCTGLILEHRIPKVVFGMRDPYPEVAGKGIALLRSHGVEVIGPVEEAACREQQKRFIVFHREKRPYVILKWAESRDGFMAPAGDGPRWISSEASRTLVHRWRTEEDAVLVGTRTAAADDPRLDVRRLAGRHPVRIVIDRELRLPRTLHLFDGRRPTVVLTAESRRDGDNVRYLKTDFGNFPHGALHALHGMGIQSVIVEGGRETIRGFIDTRCWDEIRRFTGTGSLGGGLRAPQAAGNLRTTDALDGDVLDVFSR